MILWFTKILLSMRLDIIKTEKNERPQGGGLQHTMQTIPWDVLQLVNLQGKYCRKPSKVETNYLW